MSAPAGAFRRVRAWRRRPPTGVGTHSEPAQRRPGCPLHDFVAVTPQRADGGRALPLFSVSAPPIQQLLTCSWSKGIRTTAVVRNPRKPDIRLLRRLSGFLGSVIVSYECPKDGQIFVFVVSYGRQGFPAVDSLNPLYRNGFGGFGVTSSNSG